MKGKRLLILGAAFALGLSACANSATMVRKTPLRAASVTGNINFGSATGSIAVNSTSVTGNDTQGNAWTITTVMSETSFTQNASYSQIGAAKKPATSIAFTMTLPQPQTITDFSAKFGGFNGTAGNISLSIDDTVVGSGELNGTSDVIVNSNSEASGSALTINVSDIEKGVKAYYISYSYSNGSADPVKLNSPSVQYNAATNSIQWADVNHATKYQVSVGDENHYEDATSPYNGNFQPGNEYTVFVKAIGDGVDYQDSDAGSNTFTAVAPFVSKNYILCKSVDDLVEGDTIIIGNAVSGDVKFLSTSQNENNRSATSEISVSNGLIASISEIETLTLGKSNDNWTLHANTTSGFLYAASNSANHLKTRTENTDANSEWSIDIDTDGVASVVAQGTHTHNQLKNNGNLFSCYTSGQTDVSIWKEYKELSSLRVTGTPNKLSGYFDTEEFDPTGISSYEAVYADSSTKTLSADKIKWQPLEAGMETIKGSYTENGVTVYTPAYNISVSADSLSSVSLNGNMKSSYYDDENWDKGSIVVTAAYASGKSLDVTSDSSFAYYSDSAMNNVLQSPADLENGENTVYVKATYSGVSNTNGYSQTINVLGSRPGSQNNPYTVAQARAAIDAGEGVDEVYATGTVSEIVTAYSSQYGNISYNISTDGLTTSDQLEVYRGKSYDGENFASEDDILVGDLVVVYGNLTKYGSTYEFASGSHLISKIRPEISPEEKISKITTRTTLSSAYNKEDGSIVGTDALNYSFTGITGTSYANWSNKTGASGAAYAGHTGGANSSIQLNDNADTGIVVTTSAGVAKKVTVVWNSNTADARVLNVFGSNTSYTSPSDLSGSNKGKLLGTIVNGQSTELLIDGSYKFIGFRSNKSAMYLDSISIQWADEPTFSFSKATIRFGGLMQKALWDELDTDEHLIAGYGVMFATESAVGSGELKELSPNNTTIFDRYTALTETKLNPTLATDEQKAGLVDADADYYIWNLCINMTAEQYFTDSFISVAYIQLENGSKVFMKQTLGTSVKSLAAKMIADGVEDDGSLSYLAGL